MRKGVKTSRSLPGEHINICREA